VAGSAPAPRALRPTWPSSVRGSRARWRVFSNRSLAAQRWWATSAPSERYMTQLPAFGSWVPPEAGGLMLVGDRFRPWFSALSLRGGSEDRRIRRSRLILLLALPALCSCGSIFGTDEESRLGV